MSSAHSAPSKAAIFSQDSSPQYDRLIRSTLSRPSKNEIRIPVERKYFAIATIQDPQVFWDVLIQCVHYAHKLYSQQHYLHRNISPSTLGYYIDEQTGKFIGVMFDLDHDIVSMDAPQESSAHFRTSPAPSMEQEPLD